MSRSVWLFCRIFEQLCCIIISNYSVKLTCGLLRTYGSSANRNTDTCEYPLQGYYVFSMLRYFSGPHLFQLPPPSYQFYKCRIPFCPKIHLYNFKTLPMSLHVSSPLCISACTNILKQFAITIKLIEQWMPIPLHV